MINSQLVEYLISQMEERDHAKSHFFPAGYVKECRTLRLDFGRGVGHTTTIMHMANENDLILVHSTQMLKHYKNFGHHKVYQIESLRDFRLTDELINRVYVDVASHIRNEDIELLYKYVIKSHDQMVIMMG